MNPRLGPGSKSSGGKETEVEPEKTKWEWIIVEDLEPEKPLDSMNRKELRAYKTLLMLIECTRLFGT